ncbi:hypothetical protein ACQP08_22895 [Micromonospora zamorensis]|uniref:hypothetical protein n=1 Tax=Micromonospora zamorensis TaxID=709883 RepID=UPI003D92FF6D
MKLLFYGTDLEYFSRCGERVRAGSGPDGWLKKIAQVTPSLGRRADRPGAGREKRHIDMLLSVWVDSPIVV